MRYGYWLPVFGGWLRNVEQEGMQATWEYARNLAQRSEQLGYDPTLTAELFLNDIKGIDAPTLVRRPRPLLYAGGESEAAKNLITRTCDAYVMHGDPPERIQQKIADMRRRRELSNLPPMQYGMAAYAIVRETEREARSEVERITNVRPGTPGYQNYQESLANTQLEQRVSLEEYSVSNRGLRANLVGTPEQVSEHVAAFEKAGVDLLLQFSPQLEQTESFSRSVIQGARVN